MTFKEIAERIGPHLQPRCEIEFTVYKSSDGAIRTSLNLYDWNTESLYLGDATRRPMELDVRDMLTPTDDLKAHEEGRP